MEPNHNNYSPSLELPNPQESGSQSAPEQSVSSQPETRGMQAPNPSGATGQLQQTAITDSNPIPLATTPIAGAVQPVQYSSAALIADDTDLIEKEWVTRAKAIVMQTRDDPHKQNTEMSKVKADYLKKRYNKDLKISEN